MEEDKQQWLSIAAVVLVIAGMGYFLYRQSRQTQEPIVESGDIIAEEKANEFLKEIGAEVPEGAERATLRDVEGGNATGIVTREAEEKRQTEIVSVLAALPDLESGMFYEGYLVGEAEEKLSYLGKLKQIKGGWNLEKEMSTEQLEGMTTVRVTREKVNDKKPEVTVLEASLEKTVNK